MALRKRFSGRPGYVAVVDDDTHRVIRWEKAPERKNPIGDVATMRARNPQELVTHDANPHQPHSTMERENAVSEYASEVLSLLESGGTIFLGDLAADYIFGYVDSNLLSGQNPTLRKGVNWLGPAIAGVFVYNASTNKYVRGVAVGHAFNSARKIATWGLSTVFSNGDSSGDSGDGSSDNGTSRRLSRGPRPALRGMSGTYASQVQSNTSVSGAERTQGTVMAGA